jgi:hypothetical protein
MDVAAMLSELPENYRRVITLFYLEAKSYRKVAAMLGLPLGTVKTLIFRAKKELLRIGSRGTGGMTNERNVLEIHPRQSTVGPAADGFTGLKVLPNPILL